MSGKSRLDPIALRELHAKGTHPSEAGKLLNCHPGSVIAQWHNMGLAWERKSSDLRKKLTPEHEAEVVARALAGERAPTLRKVYGVDKGTIYNILKRHNIGTRSVSARRKVRKFKRPQISERDLEIGQRYKTGERCPAIAAATGVSECTVRHSLKKQGLFLPDTSGLRVLRPANHRNKGLGKGNREVPLNPDLRHDAFEILDDHSLYWLGFLMADGNVFTKNAYGQACVTLNLGRRDRPHLEKFKAWMRSTTAISNGKHFSFGKWHEMSSFAFRSDRVAAALNRLGVVDHKEGRFIDPVVMNSRDFWRGLVDGDGSIYSPFEGVGYLCGQPLIIDAWTTFCESICGKGCINRIVRESVTVGWLRYQANGKLVFPLLYRGALVSLDRKMAEARDWW